MYNFMYRHTVYYLYILCKRGSSLYARFALLNRFLVINSKPLILKTAQAEIYQSKFFSILFVILHII